MGGVHKQGLGFSKITTTAHSEPGRRCSQTNIGSEALLCEATALMGSSGCRVVVERRPRQLSVLQRNTLVFWGIDVGELPPGEAPHTSVALHNITYT